MRRQVLRSCLVMAFACALEGAAQQAVPDDPLRRALALPALEELRATRERPLFAATRRPPSLPSAPLEPAPVRAEGSALPLGLEGIVIGENEGIVVFRNQNSNQIQRMRLGETFEGWTLIAIDARSVALSDGTTTVTLQLFAAYNAASGRKF
jgi:type II secretory pathway component PulC